jgi:hypothetical protein
VLPWFDEGAWTSPCDDRELEFACRIRVVIKVGTLKAPLVSVAGCGVLGISLTRTRQWTNKKMAAVSLQTTEGWRDKLTGESL